MTRSQRPLKILLVTGWYPSPADPLAGIFVREQARATARYDHVRILHSWGPERSLARPWTMHTESDGELAVYRVRYRLARLPKTSFFWRLLSIWVAYGALAARDGRPDVIHAHTYEMALPALLLARRLHLPLVITEHSSAFMQGTLRKSDALLTRFAFRRADRVVCVSQALQRSIERCGMQARFAIIPNPVDTALFHPGAEQRDRAPALHKILFAGRLVPVKGLPVLLEAAARLARLRHDWQLEIIGSGPARADYERLAKDLKLAGLVTFHGLRPIAEVAGHMREASCVVCASAAETFSVVIAEALASGTPVLTTRSGGPEELVTAANGLLVPPGDPEALCQGLAHMLDNAAGYDRAAIAVAAAERFAPERVGAQLDQLYRAVIAERQDRRS